MTALEASKDVGQPIRSDDLGGNAAQRGIGVVKPRADHDFVTVGNGIHRTEQPDQQERPLKGWRSLAHKMLEPLHAGDPVSRDIEDGSEIACAQAEPFRRHDSGLVITCASDTMSGAPSSS